MKKILAYTLALFSIALVACQKWPLEMLQSDQEGKVTVKLGFAVPEVTEETKALGETVNWETDGLWVLVYENGYRCEVIQAENITEIDSGEYTCDLTLTVSENKRNLHFISMRGFDADDAPFEETRLGSLTSADGLDAYWQIRTVSCIPYNVTGSTVWTNFLSELKGPEGSITLIRNFAKITVTNSAPNFTLASFKVFNTPKEGYIAPYISSGSSTGFVSSYDFKSFYEVLAVYPGRMPIGCTLNGYDATADTDGASFTEVGVPLYFYERPEPTENPAFVIIKGKFGSDTWYTYYKINIRDKDDKYYALLRGFRFKVNIKEVTDRGYATVLEAFNSVGSGNVSTSLEFSSTTNISDNNCRLFVNATSFTTIKAGTIEIKYKFCPDDKNTGASAVANNVIDVDDTGTTNGVEITVKSPETGIQPAIANNVDSEPDVVVDTSVDSEGWSTITVKTNSPDNLYKEQTITIRGRGTNEIAENPGTYQTTVIQRDIHIIVRPALKLFVEMAQPEGETYSSVVPEIKGSPVTVNVWMEDELPESIFPINLKIEATALTLTPKSGEQLPVESGQSASTTTPKPTFYFVKTISYTEYAAQTASNVTINAEETRKMRKSVCNFITNTAVSASDIYVSHELFTTAHTNFTNTD